jgi:hypothetical protein
VTEILEYLAQYCCSFLWGGGYRIIDSRYSPQNFGNAMVLVASDLLRMRFILERGQLLLHLQEPEPKKPDKSYSIDIVCQLITGEKQASSLLNEAYADFLRKNIREIEAKFSDTANWNDTARRMHEFELQRGREMFGLPNRRRRSAGPSEAHP